MATCWRWQGVRANAFAGRHLILGVTGGIAAYKSCDLVRRLLEREASVQVVMTEAATRFVSPLTFSALSGRPAMVDPWGGVENQMPHIALSRESDGIIVAPASADFMSRIAMGQTQDLLSSLCLAREVPPVDRARHESPDVDASGHPGQPHPSA